MNNIRNLKDPTKPMTTKTMLKWPSLLNNNDNNIKPTAMLLFLTLLTTLCTAERSSWSGLGSAGVGIAAIQNVSCIAHEVKFTCDCHNQPQAMVLPPLYGEVYEVEIRNCKALTVEANSLAETSNLQRIKFLKVEKLILKTYALAMQRHASKTPLIVAFNEVNFELIDSHAINGNIGEISFIGGRIDVIQPFGFTTINDHATLLRMDGVHVRRIEQQAFKKFVVEQMDIQNCYFESNIPSRSFYELEVLSELIIKNNRFKEAHSRAFNFKLISKLNMAGNTFQGVDGEWFEAHIRDSIIIRENYFGITSEIAFRAIQLHRDYQLSERLELRFINNTIQSTRIEPQALEFNGAFTLGLKQLNYDNTWPCQALDMSQTPAIPKLVFFRTHSDNIYFQRATTDDAKSKSNANGNGNGNNQSFVVLSKIIESDCQRHSYVAYIVVGSIVFVMLLLLGLLLIWCHISKKRKRRKMDVVQPEPRTYKETQIIYQIENAGLLKTDL